MGWHVVIAGGGFGGLYVARLLERRLPRRSARLTLVTDLNFMLGHPPSLERYLETPQPSADAKERA